MNGMIHTKVISQHLLVLKRILSADGDYRLECTQSAEADWTAVLTAPLQFALDDMEHRHDIAEAAVRRK